MRSVLCVAAVAALALSAPAAQAASFPKMMSKAWAKVTSPFKGDGKAEPAKAATPDAAVAPEGAPTLILYSDAGLQGRELRLAVDTPNLKKLSFNNLARSARIPDGETWELCNRKMYRGRCKTFTGEVRDLTAMAGVSSARKLTPKPAA